MSSYLANLAAQASFPPTFSFLVAVAPLAIGLYLVYTLFIARKRVGPFGVFSTNAEGQTILRSIVSPDVLTVVSRNNPGKTLPEVFAYTAERRRDRRCLGTRAIISVEEVWVEARKANSEVIHQGDYSWMTYGEVQDTVRAFGAGLLQVGGKPGQNLAIYAETKAEWLMSFHGSLSFSIPVLTVYASLGQEAIVHALNEGKVSVVVCDGNLVRVLAGVYKSIPSLKTIIYLRTAKADDLKALPSSIRALSFEDVVALGKNSPADPIPPRPDDLAVIMYTSGSTDLPKGVMVSHANIVACMSGLEPLIPGADGDTVYIGYLPLAHILELTAENLMICIGACIGYGSPFTLTDASPKTKPGTKGDAPTLKPTLMAAVPLVLDRMRAAVTAKVSAGSALKQKLFKAAIAYKSRQLKKGLTTPLIDATIFKAVRAAVGGRVTILLSGGAPLSPETQDFVRNVICPVGQGYGLTETCGGATVCHWSDTRSGRAGMCIASNELKLVDWEEGNYRNSDRENPAIGMPRGEICISGGNVTLGYYLHPEKTDEVYKIDSDGKRWFYTGDIGAFHPDGVVEIIDRKKDLVKLAGGEYVSYGKVEKSMKNCPLVDMACCYANPLQTRCVAVVSPPVAAIVALAATLNVTGSFAELCANPVINKAVLESLQAACKANKLKDFEIPYKIMLTDVQWTPESDLVTAAMKLKRKSIETRYMNGLTALYASK